MIYFTGPLCIFFLYIWRVVIAIQFSTVEICHFLFRAVHRIFIYINGLRYFSRWGKATRLQVAKPFREVNFISAELKL